MKAHKQDIKVRMYDSGDIIIKALVIGNFGYHKSTYDDGCYDVTHIPSGKFVKRRIPLQKHAKILTEQLYKMILKYDGIGEYLNEFEQELGNIIDNFSNKYM